MTYTTTKFQYPEVQKQLKRFTKKLDKYGFKWHFEFLNEHPEEVIVWAVDPANGVELYEKDKYVTTVVEFEFECDTLKLGNYIPIACITHNACIDRDNNELNRVCILNSSYTIPEEWYHIESKCEHCKTNRFRKTTYMLLDIETGKYIQVGSTCVDEFVGINALDILRAFEFFNSIIEEAETFTESMFSSLKDTNEFRYVPKVEYLAHCIERVETVGYKKYDKWGEDGVSEWKETTKVDAFERCFNKVDIDNKYLDKATKMIEDFKKAYDLPEYKSYFYREIADVLTNNLIYTEMNSLIAYAPVAYERLLEVLKEEELHKLAIAKSAYYGNVGDKVELQLTLIARRGFETRFGYRVVYTNVYTFINTEGNQFVWFTTKDIKESDKPMTIKGTIKGHSEFNGIKQTVLTKCKVS